MPDEKPAQTKPQETTPAQEWGERLDTGKSIDRGGKESGDVEGAESDEEPSASDKYWSIRAAMALLGDESDPEDLAEAARAAGCPVDPDEAASIRVAMLMRPRPV